MGRMVNTKALCCRKPISDSQAEPSGSSSYETQDVKQDYTQDEVATYTFNCSGCEGTFSSMTEEATYCEWCLSVGSSALLHVGDYKAVCANIIFFNAVDDWIHSQLSRPRLHIFLAHMHTSLNFFTVIRPPALDINFSDLKEI